ncbi:formate dehydrogenase subunit delta [Streptomyces polyrhachis]|uniref:Formate dehydrogenase subunit delta n=1 Tax=Streptomyces polyrhachis TaxID=1282885 RepID=A0ABW2GKC4_9ACTN
MSGGGTLPVLRLAGDIAAQFRHVPGEEAAVKVADHVRLFWDPRMRAQLRTQVEREGEHCDPVVRRAAALLAEGA